MSGPADPFERALSAAFTPPAEVRVCPTAGVRLRGRVASRRAQRAAAGVVSCLMVGAVAVLTVGTVLHGQQSPAQLVQAVPNTATVQLAVPPGGDVPVLPWDGQASGPLGTLSYGESILTHPLHVVELTPATYRQCPQPGDGTCADLPGQVVLVVKRLTAVDVTTVMGTAGAGVALTLGQSDTVSLAAYTKRHLGGQVAFVIAGRAWSAATISRPVTTGVIEIAAGHTQADAVTLVRSLGLRDAAKPRWMPVPW